MTIRSFKIKAETAKAILVSIKGFDKYWLPKSRAEDMDGELVFNGWDTMVLKCVDTGRTATFAELKEAYNLDGFLK